MELLSIILCWVFSFPPKRLLAIIFIWKIAGDSNGSDGSQVFSDDEGKLNATFLGWRRGKDY